MHHPYLMALALAPTVFSIFGAYASAKANDTLVPIWFAMLFVGSTLSTYFALAH